MKVWNKDKTQQQLQPNQQKTKKRFSALKTFFKKAIVSAFVLTSLTQSPVVLKAQEKNKEESRVEYFTPIYQIPFYRIGKEQYNNWESLVTIFKEKTADLLNGTNPELLKNLTPQQIAQLNEIDLMNRYYELGSIAVTKVLWASEASNPGAWVVGGGSLGLFKKVTISQKFTGTIDELGQRNTSESVLGGATTIRKIGLGLVGGAGSDSAYLAVGFNFYNVDQNNILEATIQVKAYKVLVVSTIQFPSEKDYNFGKTKIRVNYDSNLNGYFYFGGIIFENKNSSGSMLFGIEHYANWKFDDKSFPPYDYVIDQLNYQTVNAIININKGKWNFNAKIGFAPVEKYFVNTYGIEYNTESTMTRLMFDMSNMGSLKWNAINLYFQLAF